MMVLLRSSILLGLTMILASILFPSSSSRRVKSSLARNSTNAPAGHPISTRTRSRSPNSTTVFDAQYTRDQLERITQKIEAIGGTTDTYDYLYDPAGRLQEVKKNDGTLSVYTYNRKVAK